MKWFWFLLFIPFLGFSQEVEIFYFDFDNAVLNKEESIRFKEFSKKKDSIIIQKIHGFCDIKGNNPYNDFLSEKRANYLANILQSNDFIFSDSIQIKGFGKRFEQHQIQSKNRKTEVWYSRIEKVKTTEIFEITENPKSPEIIEKIEEDKEEEETKKPSLTEMFDNAKKGDVIIINDIQFFFDSNKIKKESEPILRELVYNLESYPPLKIEIQAHICCNPDKDGIENLSEKRAKAIYRYLTKSGVSKKRLSYSYYGSTKPIYPIPEQNEKERQANRRIEILILNK